MHEVISDEGIALQLNAWQTELCKCNPAWKTLELVGQLKPLPEYLKSIADYLAVNYVAGAGPNVRVNRIRGQPQSLQSIGPNNIGPAHLSQQIQ
jgi:hypothetical protein